MPKPLTRGCIGYPYILLHAYGWRVKDKEGYVMLQLTYVIELKTVEDWAYTVMTLDAFVWEYQL